MLRVMTDRQLLELAAKAARYDARSDGEGGLTINTGVGRCRDWNPLTDDGDALRLAVQCGMEVSFVDDEPDRNDRDTRACVGYVVGNDPTIRYVFEDHHGDIFEATRLAIVRAAVEIGRAMK